MYTITSHWPKELVQDGCQHNGSVRLSQLLPQHDHSSLLKALASSSTKKTTYGRVLLVYAAPTNWGSRSWRGSQSSPLGSTQCLPLPGMRLQSLLKIGLVWLIVFLCVLICANRAFFVNKKGGDVGVLPQGSTSSLAGDNIGLLTMKS